jgi:hypothetical protein
MSFVFGIFKFSESHVKCCAIMSGYRRAPAYSGRDRQQLLPSNELFFFEATSNEVRVTCLTLA